MKKISEFNIFKRLILKATHKLQKYMLYKGYGSVYRILFKLHFKMYFGMELEESIIQQTPEGLAALRRHGKMVIDTIYPNQPLTSKKMLYKASMRSFRDNLLLEMSL